MAHLILTTTRLLLLALRPLRIVISGTVRLETVLTSFIPYLSNQNSLSGEEPREASLGVKAGRYFGQLEDVYLMPQGVLSEVCTRYASIRIINDRSTYSVRSG